MTAKINKSDVMNALSKHVVKLIPEIEKAIAEAKTGNHVRRIVGMTESEGQYKMHWFKHPEVLMSNLYHDNIPCCLLFIDKTSTVNSVLEDINSLFDNSVASTVVARNAERYQFSSNSNKPTIG